MHFIAAVFLCRYSGETMQNNCKNGSVMTCGLKVATELKSNPSILPNR